MKDSAFTTWSKNGHVSIEIAEGATSIISASATREHNSRDPRQNRLPEDGKIVLKGHYWLSLFGGITLCLIITRFPGHRLSVGLCKTMKNSTGTFV